MEIPFGPQSALLLLTGSGVAATVGYLAASHGWAKQPTLPQAWGARQRGMFVGAAAYWLPFALFTLWVGLLSPFPQAATDMASVVMWGALGVVSAYALSLLFAKVKLRGWWKLLPLAPVIIVCSPLLVEGVTLGELAAVLAFTFVSLLRLNLSAYTRSASRDKLRTAEDAEVEDAGLRSYLRHRDGMQCLLCGSVVVSQAGHNYDHVKPHSRGGRTRRDNLVVVHEGCNKRKGASFTARHSLLASTVRVWERREAKTRS